jgi:hypothetical protein
MLQTLTSHSTVKLRKAHGSLCSSEHRIPGLTWVCFSITFVAFMKLDQKIGLDVRVSRSDLVGRTPIPEVARTKVGGVSIGVWGGEQVGLGFSDSEGSAAPLAHYVPIYGDKSRQSLMTRNEV